MNLKFLLSKKNGTDILQNDIRMSSDFSSKKKFPETKNINISDGFPVDILYSAFKSPPMYSELTAIIQYMDDESMFDDLSRLFTQIGIIEMFHYDKLSDIITQLGGSKNIYWDNSYIMTFTNRIDQLNSAIEGELATINNYQYIEELILDDVNVSPTSSIILETIRVIKEDEYIHLNAFTNMLKKLL